MKDKVFEKELSYIKNEKIKKAAILLLNLLPDYFFEIPASSTGKYHPSYALGEAGLVRHTKVVVRIGYELLSNNSINGAYTSDEKDLLMLAMLLHDGFKSGITKEKYTRVDHPLLVANFINDNKEKLDLSDEYINLLKDSIASHMGEWNTDFKGNEVLPKPTSKYQRFVHMCDYLASKKFIEVSFENNDILN